MVNELKKRKIHDKNVVLNRPALLNMVRELIDQETTKSQVDTLAVEVAEHMNGSPTAYITKIIKHIQNLFDIKTIEGYYNLQLCTNTYRVLPKINEVYRHVSETTNLFRSLKSILG